MSLLPWILRGGGAREKTQEEPRPTPVTVAEAAEVAEVETSEAEAEAEAQTATCVVCFDRFPPERGVSCREGHFLCGAAAPPGAPRSVSSSTCLSGHVHARGVSLRRVNRLAALAAEAAGAGDTRRAQELAGAVFCPVPGCSAPPHTDADVVRHVAEEAGVTRYLESRRLLPVAVEVARVFEQAQTTLRAAQDEFEGRAHAGAARREARRLLEQQLVSHYPNGRQCGSCGFGPVDLSGCRCLASHHGQRTGNGAGGASVVSNACPSCGWFSPDSKAWPRWKGRLLPEREGGGGNEQGYTAERTISPELARSLSNALSFVTTPTGAAVTDRSRPNRGDTTCYGRNGPTTSKREETAAAARESAAAKIAVADARAAAAAAAARVVATTDALASARAAVTVGPVTPARGGGAHDREMQRAMQMSLEEHVLDQARQLSLDEGVLLLARQRERRLIDASNPGRRRCTIS
jgi:hypothetical protein